MNKYLWSLDLTMGDDTGPWVEKDFIAENWTEAVLISETFIEQERTTGLQITKLSRGIKVDFPIDSSQLKGEGDKK
jgi:hypothetical protein